MFIDLVNLQMLMMQSSVGILTTVEKFCKINGNSISFAGSTLLLLLYSTKDPGVFVIK